MTPYSKLTFEEKGTLISPFSHSAFLNNCIETMSIQLLPGGHCLICHKDFEIDILTHRLDECPLTTTDPTPCTCDTKYKI